MLSRALACFCLLILSLPLTAQVYKCNFGSSSPRVVVKSVVFRTSVLLPPASQRSIQKQLSTLSHAIHKADWQDTLRSDAEQVVREEYLNRGYLRALVDAELLTIADQGNAGTVKLIFSIQPGKQYRMGIISWRGNSAIPTDQLAATIPIRAGEIFQRQKIAAGLESLRELYQSRGYVNFTSVPTPIVDEQRRTVSFDIDIDEGRQFFFGDLDLNGIEPAHAQILLSAWSKLNGKPCDPKAADEFFKRYFRPLRADIKPKDYVQFRVNERTATVDYSVSLTRNRALDALIPKQLPGL